MSSQDYSGQGEHAFLSLVGGPKGIVMTYSASGHLYFLDMANSGIVAWTSMAPYHIKKLVLLDRTLTWLDSGGRIKSLSFGSLSDVLSVCHCVQQYETCADLLLQNRKAVKSVPVDVKRKILEMRGFQRTLSSKERASKLAGIFDGLAKDREVEASRRRMSSGPPQAAVTNGCTETRGRSQDRSARRHRSNETLLQGQSADGELENKWGLGCVCGGGGGV